MRIALAMINCNRRDGHSRAVNEVIERLAARGHEMHLFARTAEDLDLSAIQWHRVGGPGRPEIANFWSYFVQANKLLAHHDFDLVHSIGCNTLRADVVTIQNIQPAKRRVLAQYGSNRGASPARRLTRWLHLAVTSAVEKKLYTRGNRPDPLLFLPVSRGVENELRTFYDIGDSSVRIIPNAADTALFHPVTAAERSAWRAVNGLKDAHVIAFFSGGEWARKGLDYAIKAVARVADPNFCLFVAGDDSDREHFKAIAAEYGVSERIVFGGFRKDVALAMASSDLFLFPSHYEAFSLATIEAAACGLPIVATKINGSEDFIQPGETGFFAEEDPDDIARQLRPLVADANLRATMGEKARQLVAAHYTWDHVADLTERAYTDWLEKRRS